MKKRSIYSGTLAAITSLCLVTGIGLPLSAKILGPMNMPGVKNVQAAEVSGIFSWIIDSEDEKVKIANATVTVSNTETGEVKTAVSDGEGYFELPLPAGSYTLTVQAEGYQDYTWPDGNNDYDNPILVDEEDEMFYIGGWIQMKKGIGSAAAAEGEAEEPAAPDSGEAVSDFNIEMMESPQYGYISEHTDQWLNPQGGICVQDLDLDNDGAEEKFVMRLREEEVRGDNDTYFPIWIEIYEQSDNGWILQAEAPFTYSRKDYTGQLLPKTAMGLNRNTWNEITAKSSLIVREGEAPYLFFQHRALATRFADGSTNNSWLMQYDGTTIKEIASFVQTDGGSCDFAFNGYEFENGEIVSDQALYSEVYGATAMYGDYNTAIRSFFQKFGVNITSSTDKLWGYKGPYVDDTEKTPLIMELTVEYTSEYGQRPYEIRAFLGDKNYYGNPIPASGAGNGESSQAGAGVNDGWLRAYADILYGITNPPEYTVFELAFVDDNDIPELIVTYGAAHVSSPEYYTYCDGKAVDVGNFGSYGATQYGPRSGYLLAAGMSHGYNGASFYKLENGTTSLFHKFDDNEGAVINESEQYHHMDDVEVGKDVYNSEMENIRTTYHFVYAGAVGHGEHAVNAENIRAMLANPADFVCDDGKFALPEGGLAGVSGAEAAAGGQNAAASYAVGTSGGAGTADGEKDFAVTYAMEGSDSRYLTNEEVNRLDAQAACYAKNEIYARHGRKFMSKELQDFFGSKSWYQGTVDPNSFSEGVFNDFERKNIAALAQREKSVSGGGYALDQPGYDIYRVK